MLVHNTVPTIVLVVSTVALRTLATLQIVSLATPTTLSLNCPTQITPAVRLEYVKAKMVSVSLRVNA